MTPGDALAPPLGAVSLAIFVALFAASAWLVRVRPVAAIVLLGLGDSFVYAHRVLHTNVTTEKVVVLASLLGLVLRGVRGEVFLNGAPRRLLVASSLLVGATALTFVSCTYVDAVARETLKALEYLAVFAVATAAYFEDPDERVVVAGLASTVALTCGLALVQEKTGAPSMALIAGRTIPRIAGPLEGPNQFAGYLDIAAPLMLALALSRRSMRLGAVYLLCAAASVLTLSRAGALGAITGTFVTIARAAGGKRFATVLAGGAIALGLGLAAISGFTHRLTMLDDPDLGSGLGTRGELWPAALYFFRSHPLLGIGAGNFELSLDTAGLIGVHTHANSLYLQALAEGGIVLFLATIGALAIAIATFLGRSRNPLAIGAGAATLALALHETLDYLTFDTKVGGWYWLVAGLGAAALAKDAREQPAAAEISPWHLSTTRRIALAGAAALAITGAAIFSWHEPKAVSTADTGATASVIEGRAVPVGVIATLPQRIQQSIDGLYPVAAQPNQICCWLAPHARVWADEPVGATVLVVAVIVPDFPFFARAPQHVSIEAAGALRDLVFVHPGLQKVEIPLAGAYARAGPLPIVFESSRIFVPAAEHLNSDTRELAVVLRGVGFRGE